MLARRAFLSPSVAVLALLALRAPLPLFGADIPMRAFTVDLPNHVLRFSVPEEIARQMGPLQADKTFDPRTSASYASDGFWLLASKYYQFQGPFWVGAYGALRFHFTVVKRESGYRDRIATPDTLARYVPWWMERLRDAEGYTFGQMVVASAPWAFRRKSTFGQVAQGAEEMQGFSCPIDEAMFLDVGFWITETVPGSTPKWKPLAEAFREAMKATMALSTKSAVEPAKPPPR